MRINKCEESWKFIEKMREEWKITFVLSPNDIHQYIEGVSRPFLQYLS